VALDEADCCLLGASLVIATLSGAMYQQLATRKELAATPPPGRLVDLGGYRLHLWCTGDGAPAVILDAGLGGTSAGWGFVQPEVARFTRVCSYDRAGMATAIPGRHRGQHAASQASWPNSSRVAGLPDQSCSSGNP
jgi:hypothetical protein